ncbi:MAG: fumarylacetoacetate hydrolase family protein [Hyphomonadaceae bacterium]
MKLASFTRQQGGLTQIGVVSGEQIFPATGAEADLDMRGLIARWDELKSKASDWAKGAGIPLSSVRLMAPIARPEKIMAIGLNYADHVAESGLETPKEQIWFCKQPSCTNGPYDPIQIPKASSSIDYEVELVAVIGKRCKHVSREKAAEVIFGYCVGNDVSTRDWQLKTPQWVLGKSFDTHGPYGPWITTADEVGDPHALDISCKVNGELRQNSNTKHLIFNVFAQIEELTKAMTLEPGDVIFCGTPGGVGVAMKPPKFLKAGDRVTCEISKLGRIEGVMTPEE